MTARIRAEIGVALMINAALLVFISIVLRALS